MKAFHLLGVAAFLMLSACASTNREGRVQHSFVYPTVNSSYISTKPLQEQPIKERHSSQETIMACGQVLSFWAGHLR